MKQRTFAISRILILSLAVFLFLAVTGFAAPDEEDYDEGESAPAVAAAHWSIDVDAGGRVRTSLFLSGSGKLDRETAKGAITAALEESLHCRMENVSIRDRYGFTVGGDCRSLARQGFGLSGAITPGPVYAKVQEAGITRMTLSLGIPKAGYGYCTGAGNDIGAGGSMRRYFLMAEPEKPIPAEITVRFGYSVTDVLLRLAGLLVLFIAPLLVVLRVRRKSLLLASENPTTAWFGFWRVYRHIAQSAWVVWAVALSLLNAADILRFIPGIDRSVALGLLYAVPPAVMIFICQYLSRPVWREVRSVEWGRKEMLLKSVAEQAATGLPFVFFFLCITTLPDNTGWATLWLALAVVATIVGVWLHGKVSRSIPSALHGGELKERILEISRRAGIKIQQAFIMPARANLMGNAFAIMGNKVMITDYLLERLTRKETDCVVGHEVAHLKYRHTLMLSWLGFIGIYLLVYLGLSVGTRFLPVIVYYSGVRWARGSRLPFLLQRLPPCAPFRAHFLPSLFCPFPALRKDSGRVRRPCHG